MERRAWQTTVHGLAQSQPRLSAHSPSLTLAPTTGGRRSSQTAEGVASKSKERKFSSNSVALNNGSKKKKKNHGSATFREIVHFTEVALLGLTYSADLHYLETYLFPIVLESMSVVESHLLFQ